MKIFHNTDVCKMYGVEKTFGTPDVCWENTLVTKINTHLLAKDTGHSEICNIFIFRVWKGICILFAVPKIFMTRQGDEYCK